LASALSHTNAGIVSSAYSGDTTTRPSPDEHLSSLDGRFPELLVDTGPNHFLNGWLI
jgi:hypothetical protein